MRFTKEPIEPEEQEREFIPRNQALKVKTSKKKKKNKVDQNKTKMQRFMSEAFSIIVTFLVSLAILFLLQTFLFKFFTVAGNSMYPSLHNGDRMIMSKINAINRFDIVVIDSPDETEEYIKRVIGMPGDEITVFQGQLYINGQRVDQPFINTEAVETKTVPIGDFTLYSLFGVSKVPEGNYFVMGDNRDISKDSRMIGFVSKEHIKGEAVFTLWPLNRIGIPKGYADLYSDSSSSSTTATP